jgi:hypothetical protein
LACVLSVQSAAGGNVQEEASVVPGMSASRRNRGAQHVDNDQLGDGFYRAYGFKRGYGRAHNGKGGGRVRRRILRAKGNVAWRRGNGGPSW